MSEFTVSQEERYQKVDYSYTSGNSAVSISHFREMATEIASRVGVNDRDLVVDIGSSDGTLLASFRDQYGCKILGIEPAPNIAALASSTGIPTMQDFFTSAAVTRITKEGRAKAITANNVYNHITDLNTFMKDVFLALTDDGQFVFEAPSLLELVRRTAFDTIYLEHVSYFGLKPLKNFYKQFGLFIQHAELNDYMGGSMRVYVGKKNSDDPTVDALIKEEETAHIYDPATYADFMRRVKTFRTDLCKRLYEIKAAGGVIVGIGAATKGNTLLNYCGIDSGLLECVTDSSALKIGKITPGSHLPIIHDADIPINATHALILPWNIGAFLKEKLKHLPLEFIVPNM